MKNEIEFPSCWEEVHPAEWQKLLKLRERLMTEEGISLMDVQRKWTEFVLKRRGLNSLGSAQGLILINDIAQTLDWQWQTTAITTEDGRNGIQIALTYDSLVNLLPCYGPLFGPASYGADLTFGEFRRAITAMNNYTQEHDEISLLALCGILYRKVEKVDGVKQRIPFKQALLSNYMQAATRIPEHLRWGIYAWFSNFCEYVYTGTFIIDGKEICFAPLFERSKSDDGNVGNSQDLGMTSILYSVAESGVFGNADQTDNTLLLSVLMKMLNDKQHIDQLKKK